MFLISYEYSINFTNLLKLFEISKKYFWTFMEVCSPMIKIGTRKATMMRKSVEKMLQCIQDPSLTYEILTPYEDKVLEAFKMCVVDSFTDGEGCLHISQFETMPFAKAYGKNGLLAASDYKSMLENVDNIEYVQIGDNKLYKTSKLMFYIEKYCEDLEMQKIDRMPVKQLIRLVQDGEDALHEKEVAEFGGQDKLWI